MIQHNSLLSCAAASTSPHAAQAAASLHLGCPSPEATNAANEPPASEIVDSQQELSQKDFAVALAISQARVSQLVKIGMPLNSIAAAQEWRIKQQGAAKDVLQVAESAAAALPSVIENNQLSGPHASSLPRQPLDSSAAAHSSFAAAAMSTPKQYFSREQLESLTILELRELCKPRGLKVCGVKNDLVFRLIFSYATDAQISGNYELLRDLSTGDLHRICRQRGLSTSGSTNDLILRLAEPVSATRDEVLESHAQSINQHHPPPSNSSSASRTAAVAAVASLHKPKTSAHSPSASSNLLTVAPAAASTPIASSSSSSSTSSIQSISRILPSANSPPSSISRASSSSLDTELPLKRALHAKPAQPVLPKTLPRAQVASLDLYFPVPSDPVFSVTAPILLDTTSSVSGTDLTPFTLIENEAPHHVQTFPLFVLPAPPRTFTQAAPNQRLPAGLGLSSCVATQYFPHNSTFITSFSYFFTSPGTTSVFLVSPQALANCVAFLFQKAAVHIT